MKRSAVLALVGTGVLVLTAGCGSTTSAAETTWATVNGHTITQQDVQTRVNLIKVLSPQSTSQLKQRTTWVNETQELVSEYIVQQEAAKAKFTLTATQQSTAKSQLMSYLTSTYGSKTALNAAIKKDKTSTAALDSFAVEATLLQSYLQKVVKVPTVTSSAVTKFYNTNMSQFQQPEEYDLAHILVKTQSQAESILKQLQAGASFSALAKQYSTDTASAKNGGDLGYAPLSNYVTPFADAAKKLTQVGQISGVVHSQFGYHIIKLLGIKKPTTQPLSAVSSQIQSYLQQQNQQTAQQAYINKLRTKTKVKVTVPKTVPAS
ncbi:MAG: peptidylprolyl isomerase [Thermaerobacter sp.]|nr:peptidylprolyl isomerase [Thermaerobacter sp.]